MQAYFKWLEPTIADKLNQQPAGAPVFVRMFLQLSPDHGLLRSTLAAALGMSSKWLGAAQVRIEERGGAREGFLTAMAEYAGGQSALVTVEAASGDPTVSILVMGQQGSLKFDDYPEPEVLR
ncbi:MAG: hypothetical protein FJW39_26250 [Acidobacteria bacterium]|nr:hypothetical protein [Acidobacteriota bacterium]